MTNILKEEGDAADDDAVRLNIDDNFDDDDDLISIHYRSVWIICGIKYNLKRKRLNC